MILENDGVRLRAVEPEDLETLYRWENDEANWKQSNNLTPYSRYVLKKYIAGSGKTIYETGQLRLMIDILPGMRTIGSIDLFDFDHFHGRAGVGILIADPAPEVLRQRGGPGALRTRGEAARQEGMRRAERIDACAVLIYK